MDDKQSRDDEKAAMFAVTTLALFGYLVILAVVDFFS